MAPADILVLGGRPEGWHGARLREACDRHGLRLARADFRDLGFALDGRTRLEVRGIGELPRVALVRSVPAGSFEEVTLRLGLLHALEAMGVTVVNDARAIERCVDKAMTSFLLAIAWSTDADLPGSSSRPRRHDGGARRKRPTAIGSCSSRCSGRRVAACGC